jgi:pantoate--beta-alanine ligase
MRVVETIAEARAVCQKTARPLGLVPTLGGLHEGHVALFRRARSQNAGVAVSLFLNPTQFGPREDLASYPEDREADLATIGREGVDVVFAPSAGEVYPNGFSTAVDVGALGTVLEGASRPEHFKGVATVVCKLLSIVRPDRAYFGQKDAQQLLVVRRLNADLNLGAEIVAVPTVREADGLALSSRNAYLNEQEREAATVVYRSLRLARRLWEEGLTDAAEVRTRMRTLIDEEPLASIDYVSIADAETLEELDTSARHALVSLAVRIGKTRLIDNVSL